MDPRSPKVASQVRRPWRATIRTAIVAGAALIPIIPSMASAAAIDEVPAVASVVAISAGITRVLALPAVEKWLDAFVPWLAADPYEGRHRADDVTDVLTGDDNE